MKRRTWAVLLLVGMLLMVNGSAVLAGMDKEKKDIGLEDKLMMKLHMLFKNKAEIGLSEKQMKEIKDLKIGIKKELIEKNAAIEIIGIDIAVMMSDDKIDTAKIDGLIDKKYEIKKSKAKSLVKSCAKLKEILSAKQKDALKEIFMSAMDKKEKSGCGGKDCKHTMQMQKH